MLESRIGVLRLVVASLAACAASLGAPSRCSAQFVGLGTAGGYGIFQAGAGGTLTLGGGTSTTGTANVAVGPIGTYVGSSPGSFTGALTLDPSATNQSSNFTFSGGTTTTSLAGALISYIRAVNSLGSQGSGTNFTGTTVTGSSVAGSQNVFTYTGSSNLTLNGATFNIAGGSSGGANQTFIIDVTGSLNFNNVQVSLTNGVTANHVIFYVSGGDSSISGGSTFDGTLITNIGHQITVNGSTVNGALLGGDNIHFGNSGTTVLNSQSFQSTPEPGSLLLGSILAGLCGTVHYFRRRKTAA
jgi:hypothetical protein